MHKILARQLKRLKLDSDSIPDLAAWQQLLKLVGQHYQDMEDNHYMMERTVRLSNHEMQLLNEQIRKTSESRFVAERDKLKSVFESLNDGVCEVNLEGKIMFINQTGINFFHGSADEIYQLDFFRLFQLHHPDGNRNMEWQDLIELTQSGKGYRDDNAIIIRINHRILPISCIVSPVLHQNKVSSIVFLFRDISQQKRIEKQLMQATREAEYAYQAKSDFLATMSHEIRTPLNGVIGITSILDDTELDEEQQELVNTLKHSGETLLMLVNDILDFSKIEAGKLKLEMIEFNLHELIRETETLFFGQFAQKNIAFNIHIDFDDNVYLQGSPTRIQQILINLLGNALKFTHEGSVNLQVSEFDGQPGHYKFSVKDTGIGIAREQQKNIFESFSQADSSTTRKFGGSGLGLSISKRLAELMHGTIGLNSEPGQGSEFFFTVELTPIQAMTQTENTTEQEAIPVQTQVLRKFKILVVDDNKINQMVATKLLSKFNCHSDIASNGIHALETLKENQYDLILMDCQMPEMDGYEATRRIRQQVPGQLNSAYIPIIAMTANAMEGDREKCLAAGMDDYISKPVNQKSLADILHKWLTSTSD